MKHEIGSPNGQQVWESLNLLVALRVWKTFCKPGRVRLFVRGDSVTMLSLMTKMRPPPESPGLTLIAKELALDIADGSYAPDLAEHVPGIANKGPDALSRRFMPRTADQGPWCVPASMPSFLEVKVPLRCASWYRTLVVR